MSLPHGLHEELVKRFSKGRLLRHSLSSALCLLLCKHLQMHHYQGAVRLSLFCRLHTVLGEDQSRLVAFRVFQATTVLFIFIRNGNLMETTSSAAALWLVLISRKNELAN